MEAKDLMIGDWVQIKNHLDYDKVEEIAMDENLKWYISCAYSATLFRIYEFNITPILLTEEILNLNNWFNNGNDCYIYKGTDLKRNIDLIEKVLNTTNVIEYVHEFQHLLRLYNRNDMADNFKIE